MNFLLTTTLRLPGNKRMPLPVLIWFSLAAAAIIAEALRDPVNNYLIFTGVFKHLVHQQNLYAPYPNEYWDLNHYGPFFSFVIAPFTIFPTKLGVVLWSLTNAAVLLWAIKKLPFNQKTFLTMVLICTMDMMTSTHNEQFNPMLSGWMLLSFALVEQKKDFWATFFIAAGFMVKLYGIAGVAFFLFSTDKFKFAWSLVFWLVVMFCAPMLISSPSFIVNSYYDWYQSLAAKNAQNMDGSTFAMAQDICVMGMIRRIFHPGWFSNWMVLLPALLAFGLPLLRFKQYDNIGFRLRYLALVMLSVVIFSTSAESSTYVVAIPGVAIWFVLRRRPVSAWNIALLVFVVAVTSFSPSDLFPKYLRNHYVAPYSLKSLPCFIVWLLLIGEVAFKQCETPKTAIAV
ncbi:glycosyltransferase family 87 protein [Deminuibacter soli]|uniref:DUF2029 domain-containing protein n=1 Tax=Deminuibacter soli TaxID=2291815 RepID=A0A3E1NR92_9BACT|nr:glycosyltransferase family 87 protein [Deminuibacter soli]RFM30445.1 DUF2029 domain-containing protein [Deminuibacter soli]